MSIIHDLESGLIRCHKARRVYHLHLFLFSFVVVRLVVIGHNLRKTWVKYQLEYQSLAQLNRKAQSLIDGPLTPNAKAAVEAALRTTTSRRQPHG